MTSATASLGFGDNDITWDLHTFLEGFTQLSSGHETHICIPVRLQDLSSKQSPRTGGSGASLRRRLRTGRSRPSTSFTTLATRGAFSLRTRKGGARVKPGNTFRLRGIRPLGGRSALTFKTLTGGAPSGISVSRTSGALSLRKTWRAPFPTGFPDCQGNNFWARCPASFSSGHWLSMAAWTTCRRLVASEGVPFPLTCRAQKHGTTGVPAAGHVPAGHHQSIPGPRYVAGPGFEASPIRVPSSQLYWPGPTQAGSKAAFVWG